MPEAQRKDTELLNKVVAYANDERLYNEFRTRALLNEARAFYERCNTSEAVAALGIMYNVIGNAEEAVNKFRAALALSNGGSTKLFVRRNFGVALNRSGDPGPVGQTKKPPDFRVPGGSLILFAHAWSRPQLACPPPSFVVQDVVHARSDSAQVGFAQDAVFQRPATMRHAVKFYQG